MTLNVRHPEEMFVLRHENEWPLARTQWTKYYLDPEGMTLSPEPVARVGKIEYEALGKGLTFRMAPMAHATEITGPMAAKLFVSFHHQRCRPFPDRPRVRSARQGTHLYGFD